MYKNNRKYIADVPRAIVYKNDDENNVPLNVIFLNQQQAEKQNINPQGFIRNDMLNVELQQNATAASAALQRLQEVAQQNINAGKSDKQIIAEIIPAHLQTPAELERFQDVLIKMRLDNEKSKAQEVTEDVSDTAAAAAEIDSAATE